MNLSVLPDDIISSLRKNTQMAESTGMLTAEQLQVIQSEKWFYLFVPEAFGGLALSLPEAVRLEEHIAYADGSVGWVVTLCAGAAMFIGYLDPRLAKEIFDGGSYVCIAGSGQASGIASATTGDDYLITGTWPYASGGAHATHFTANCTISGSNEVRSFIFKREEVELYPNWQCVGLHATSGYSFSVNALRLPASRSFIIDADHVTLPDPVYRYPFLQLAVATIAANVAGMCRYFFHVAQAVLSAKVSTNGLSDAVKWQGLQRTENALHHTDELRRVFYAALEDSWSSHIAGKGLAASQLNAVNKSSTDWAVQSRNLVNELFPYCGMEAARTGTTINQVWLNINTASQHVLLSAVQEP